MNRYPSTSTPGKGHPPRSRPSSLHCALALTVLAGAAAPLPAAAQDIASGATGLTLVAVALVAILAAGFLSFRLLQISRKQKSQTSAIESLAKERDEARQALAVKSRELEIQLGEQIKELENENDLLSEATAKLRKLVVVDELTGLANRMHFDQVLPHEIKRALREEKSLALIFARFDWSDAFRQSYGEQRRDEALARIAEEIRTIFRRAGDLPSRYNLDTFAIIFTSDTDVAVRFAERLRKAVWSIPIPHESSQTADRVTVSVGVATITPNKVHDTAEFRRAAENAVRVAEGNGGNRVEEYRKPPSQPSPV